MIKLDARRLTGISVIWKRHGAVVDVRLNDSEDRDTVIASWNAHCRRMLDALGWDSEQSTGYRMHSGVALALSAPVDALYSAVEIAEWIYAKVARETAVGRDAQPTSDDPENPHLSNDFDTEVARLKDVIRKECDPALRNLITVAATHGSTILSDDDEASLGLGRYSTTWPIGELPSSDILASMDWSTVKDVPVGLVTGTNGKTTTVRLTQRMLRAAGHSVGH